ncbi:MAG: 2-succinyl-5-enolpyruvyl-6-hydroxy-3-cyclohexene-1-carboxylic-acid synthase [Actinomycetota bacterium]
MDTTNRNTALASALVEELARCGVRHAVLSPGSRSTPLAVALWRQPAIEVSVIVDERSAGFFALGAAQATRRPVAVLCTSGTAAANLHPAVAEADEAAVPLLLLTADRPPELRGIGAGQTIDQLKLYGSSTRWFCEVGTHEADDAGLLHYRSVACRAYAAARGEPRPGPVHLNLAWRDPLAPVPVEGDVTATSPLALEGRGNRPLTAVPHSSAAPEPALLDELAERIAAAPRGLVLVGRQTDVGLRDPVIELAAAAGYPVLAEPTSQIRLGPHDRHLVISHYDAIARLEADALAPDLVVRFGDMPTSKPLRLWLASLDECRQLVVDPGFGWNEPSNRAETLVRADASALANGLADRLSGAGSENWTPAWIDAERTAAEAVSDQLSRIDEPTEPGLQAALGPALGDGDLVYTASSMPIRDQEAFLPAGDADVLFLCNRGANGIDGLVSSGIGAAHASGRPTVVLTGDLGLLHDVGGLAALRDVRTPVRIVVVNNDGGGIFHFLPQEQAMSEEEFEALLGTPRRIDVARAADLFGIDYRRVEDLSDLQAAMAAGTGLVEIPVDRQENLALHRRLSDAASSALASV